MYVRLQLKIKIHIILKKLKIKKLINLIIKNNNEKQDQLT